MNAAAPHTWTDANQQLLVAEFAALRVRLGDTEAPSPDLEAARAALAEPAAIDQLTAIFGLSPFERSVLLLAAGIEMDGTLARLVPRLSFGLALGLLEGAHWSATSPLAPLRAWRLLELDGSSPTRAALRIDERILHQLGGLNQIDSRLLPLLREQRPPTLMAPAHETQVERLIAESQVVDGPAFVVQLGGDDAEGRRDVAAALAQASQRLLFAIAQADIPAGAAEQEAMAVLWQREAVLLPAALLIEADERHGNDASALQRFVQRLRGLVIVSSRDRLLGTTAAPAHAYAQIDKPDAAAQAALWLQALGSDTAPVVRKAVGEVASQFRLSASAIQRRAGSMGGAAAREHQAQALWQDCLEHARPALDELALRIEPAAGWSELVLPDAQTATLHQLAAQVHQRLRVHGEWGFAAQGARGLGISALFHGESGVGKTMACEVLARELALDLYRIDLSGVVSKYIGETEKNLRRVFDAAEDSGAILLFDEADALFGKRSEVKDSHDRYANIEVSYLLQRMEAYRGLAVLTSNLRASLDPAFTRRLRFVVHFPFPDLAQREAIWRRAFPAATPCTGLDYGKLARLPMAGGHIRNIAINAAFLAAAASEVVAMRHIAQAAHHEAAKHERPLSDAQTKGWAL
jgi:uncharacterized tellurite resistance protein B-like protein